MLIAVIGGIIHLISKKLMNKFEIDDGLNQVCVHGICGFWALLSAGFFDADQGFFLTGNIEAIKN